MPATHLTPIGKSRQRQRRISLWALVVLYTLALPYVIFVFRAIDRNFPSQITGHVPLFIIILSAVVFAGLCFKKNRGPAVCAVILSASGLLVFFIMIFEPNPNKHIHIPEYVLMTWLLYYALRADYRGSGLFLLIFICAAMLGVVDELMQGIHPARTYGWKDMVIDTTSAFIGVLTLMGLKDPPKNDWTWIRGLRNFRTVMATDAFGGLIAVPMSIYLFAVQERGSFVNVYPGWLLAGSGLFLAAALAVVILSWRAGAGQQAANAEMRLAASGPQSTALLWVFCPLAILGGMHLLVLAAVAYGVHFR